MSQALLKRALKRGPQVSPFLVLGDPTPKLSVALAKAAVDAGAGMIEIGFPYSDPVADGPAIQAADTRALEAGISTSQAIEILGRIRETCPKTPLNLLVYGNLVHSRGYSQFCECVAKAGASSLLVPDIPLEESLSLKRACRQANLGHVQLVGPLTSPERLQQIDRLADVFVYLVAHQGVTGVRKGDFNSVEQLITRTTNSITAPVCLGFGLSQPNQIRKAFCAGARVAVVGSYLANIIGATWKKGLAGNDQKLLGAFDAALRPLTSVTN